MSLSVLILAAAAAASAPSAHSDFDLPRATIAFDERELVTSAGQAHLRARVATEIERMCSVEGPRDPGMSRLRRACIEAASRSAEIGIARAVANARQRAGSQLAAR